MKSKWISSRMLIVFMILTLLAVTGFSTRSRAAASLVGLEHPAVVRVYYGYRENLDELAKTLDIWEVQHDQAYLVALVSPGDYEQLVRAGYRLEIDEARTAQVNTPNLALPGQDITTIPGYPCYRTVEETYSNLSMLAYGHVDLASWIDIGDSWEMVMPGDLPGYNIYALELTNKLKPGPKPTFFLMAEIHAREYVTAETAARFAEHLVNDYGIDPDITWLLDYYKVYIVPMTNPDGRKKAETGLSWRKNTDNDDGCNDSLSWGVDLNRNHSFHWGGADTWPCSLTYQGPFAASEPETNVIQDVVLSLFPDQRGPGDYDPAPLDATGLFITLHSYSELVLWPWGWTGVDAPNHIQLQTLGRKLAYFNTYTPQQSNDLYGTTGTSDDWAYGELGIAAYTFEMGTTFFQDCTSFNNTIYPDNRDSLLYAFKAARHPYIDPTGPDSYNVTVTPANAEPGMPVTLAATASDTRYYGGEPTQNIAAAQYTIDDPSWITDTIPVGMTATDGNFNAKTEAVRATVDTTCLAPGRHTLFIESKDVNNNWGVPGAVFLTVGESHGVSLSPSEVDGYVAAGEMMTYTLVVENLGNAPDTYTVTLSSDWNAFAPAEMVGLSGCSLAELNVVVEAPASAEIGMRDVATVVITSQADPALYATAQMTTTVMGNPPLVEPLEASQLGYPGQAVGYSLSITNTNEFSDTFDIRVNSGWEVDAPLTVGSLETFENASVAVTVTIPITASVGMFDVASVGIHSQNPDVLPITVTLTTTANSFYHLAVESETFHQVATPGEMVTYTFQVTNTGNLTDTYDISFATATWETTTMTPLGPLAVGETGFVTVWVHVPIDAAWGASDRAIAILTSRGDPTRMWPVTLMTSVRSPVYLPVVVK